MYLTISWLSVISVAMSLMKENMGTCLAQNHAGKGFALFCQAPGIFNWPACCCFAWAGTENIFCFRMRGFQKTRWATMAWFGCGSTVCFIQAKLFWTVSLWS
jgi:hypothetical protein